MNVTAYFNVAIVYIDKKSQKYNYLINNEKIFTLNATFIIIYS